MRTPLCIHPSFRPYSTSNWGAKHPKNKALQFINAHRKLHIDDREGLIFTPSSSDYGPYILILAASAANDGVARKVPLSIQQLFPRPMVAGSCDGLVLLILQNRGHRQVVFNPITSETAMVRDYRPLSLRTCIYGFGYDCSSDDYKIVSLRKVPDNGSFVDIYSLRTKCWRRIANCPYVLEDSPYNKSSPAPGVFLNGRLHWFGYDACGYYVHCGLICFDLAREEFVEGLLPITVNGAFDFDIKIFEGCLTLVSEPYWEDVSGDGKLSIDVWVMREYGVGDSWPKYTTIFLEKEGEEFDAAYNVVCVLNEDEIVLEKSTEQSEKLVAYNRRNVVSRDLVIAGAPEQFNRMMPFRGSLMSPNFEG